MAWTLIGSYSHAIDGTVATIAFTDLEGYQDLFFIGRDLTLSSSGYRSIQVSVDNGSTWLNGGSDYASIPSSGVPSLTSQLSGHGGSATTLARTIFAALIGSNTACPVKLAQTNLGPVATLNSAIIDAIRISPSAGSINGGFAYLYGRT